MKNEQKIDFPIGAYSIIDEYIQEDTQLSNELIDNFLIDWEFGE